MKSLSMSCLFMAASSLFMRREVELVSCLIAHSIKEISPDEGEPVRADEQGGNVLAKS